MNNQMIFDTIKKWAEAGRITFEQLEELKGWAYQKEQLDDARTDDE